MPISQSIQVFNLIKSLTKAEKRHFSLYINRVQNSEDVLFIRLFNILEKQKEFNEQQILTDLGNISKAQFSNLKRHLYSQIIASLRVVHKEKRAHFKVREYIDYAHILYGKGLYLQSLKLLKKARILAQRHHLTYMLLSIIEFEKTIETRHITRSGSNRALVLIDESEIIQQNANHIVRLSNLRIRMHAKYLQNGHVKNKQEAENLKSYYYEKLNPIDLEAIGFIERIYYVQSRVWYNYILLDFNSCMRYAKEWVALLDSQPTIINRDIDLYFRGIHYVLTSAVHTKDHHTHSKYLKKIEAIRKEAYGTFNTNTQIISFLYVHVGRLDNIMLSGNFNSNNSIIPKTLHRIRKYKYKLDDHKIMVLYYKFAWIYLGDNNPSKGILYLNKIINNELNNLREDLQDYARILQLICHYELGNYDILDYLLQTYSSYFNRKMSINIFLKQAMKMFHALKSKGELDHSLVFKNYYTIFSEISKDPYERRAFIYLDLLSWLESKILGISLQEVIQRNTLV